MPRKKKEAPNHGKYYEVKAVVGHRIDGRPVYKSFYSKISKEDARNKAEAYNVQQALADQAGEIFLEGRKTVTFGRWAEKWLEVYKKPFVDDNTFRYTYQGIVKKHLLPFFGAANLADIRPVDIIQFFSEHTEMSQSHLDKCMLCLRGIFETAVDNGLCSKDPCRNVKPQSKKHPNVKQVYSDDEIARLEDYCLQTGRMPEIILLLETGLRRGELLGLKWEDVDLGNATLSVRRSIAVDKGNHVKENRPKWGSFRTIPLSAPALKLLRHLPRAGAFIFGNPETGLPRRPDSWGIKLRTLMKRAHEEIGVPILSAHELRHTYGTRLRRHGADIYTIQKIMGHKDIDVTANTYVHNEIEVLRSKIG